MLEERRETYKVMPRAYGLRHLNRQRYPTSVNFKDVDPSTLIIVTVQRIFKRIDLHWEFGVLLSISGTNMSNHNL